MLFMRNIPIEFSKSDILRYLGFRPKKSTSSAAVEALLDQAIEAARLVIEPAVLVKTLNVERIYSQKIVFAGTSFSLVGKDIVRFMSPCTKVSFMAATIGSGIDRKIEDLFYKQEAGCAVMLDAVGSDAVEQVISRIDMLVRQEAEKQGFSTLRRVSPGYSLWSIEANKDIAELLSVGRIGIEVLPSFEMLPRKSVMAAVGWVAKEFKREAE